MRKNFAFLIQCLGVCLCLTFQLSAAPANSNSNAKTLSLGEALMRVEGENLEVLLNREAIDQAIAMQARERSALLPQLDFLISQERNQAAGSRPGNRADMRLAASFPLYDPLLKGSFQSARAGIKVSEYEYERLIQEVLSATAGIYFLHLRNLRRFAVLEANLDLSQTLGDLARRQFEAGVATQIDVTRAEVQIALDEQARLQQGLVTFESEVSLKQLLNLELREPLRVKGFSANRHLPDSEPDVDVEEVLADRPEYSRVQSQLERDRLDRRNVRRERLPSFWTFGDYGLASSELWDGGSRSVWSAGVLVSLPIFEGFRIRANEDFARSRERATALELRQVERTIEGELLLSWENMRSRLAQIQVAEKNLSLSEEELRLARLAFERGVADNRAVIDAQNRLAVANDNLVEATHQFNLSRLEYARAKGNVRLILADQQRPE